MSQVLGEARNLMFGSSPTRRLRLHFSPSQRPLACVQVSGFQFQIFSSSPRRCPTSVARVAGEMITNILRYTPVAVFATTHSSGFVEMILHLTIHHSKSNIQHHCFRHLVTPELQSTKADRHQLLVTSNLILKPRSANT